MRTSITALLVAMLTVPMLATFVKTQSMKRQTKVLLTILVVLLAIGMLVAVADPVVAVNDNDVEQDAFAAAFSVFVISAGPVAATLIPMSIEYPAQNR